MVSVGNVSWPSSNATVTVPAHADFLASVRAMTRAMAALADVALDDVEELQMAVDEAAILLLPLVDESGERSLTAEFEVEDSCVQVALSAACRPDAAVDRLGLPWVMLSAIDPGVQVSERGAGELAITITRRREGPVR